MAQKKLITKDFQKVSLKFPKMKIFWEENIFLCKGEIDVFDSNNVYWDSFKIKISIPIKKYPKFFPVLYIENNRIDKIDDRHISGDCICCVEVEQKQHLRAEKGITILQFIDEYVVPFFADQLYFEKEESWASGDYKHDFDGKLQYYYEISGINENKELIFILKNLSKIQNLKMYDLCFCGSGKKLKYCHRDALKKLLKLPKEQVLRDADKLENIISKEISEDFV